MDETAQRMREQLRQFAERVDLRMRQHFDRWRADVPASDASPTPAHLFEAVVDLTLRGGKRLRPALAYYAALCFDDEIDRESLLDASLSLELLQTALLIHDDIMDRDEIRRGGPTVHATMARQTSDPHLGNSVAILAGSLACAFAQRLLTEAAFSRDRLNAAAFELALMQERVIYGQHLDLVGGTSASVLQDLKTTSYTTRGPVRFGAALADAPHEAVQALIDYATPLGRAFQTRDDLLGAFGDPNNLGKPVGADIREGRRTELLQIALERLDAPARLELEAVLGRRDASDDEVERACRLIEDTGARAHLESLVDTLTTDALSALEGAKLNTEGAEFLAGIARFLAHRLR